MVRICEARISREIKSGKAMSERPTTKTMVLPQCGGDLTYSISMIGAGPCNCGDYCYCSGPEIHVDVNCSRCRYPYFEHIDSFTSGNAQYELERILNDG